MTWDVLLYLKKLKHLKHPKYIPVHEIQSHLSIDEVSTIPAFHMITGCSSTSQLSGNSTKQPSKATPSTI